MASSQELAVREKRELEAKSEKTVPGRFYVPCADIYETDEALIVALEMPGVNREAVDVAMENSTLRVEGKISFSNYEGLEPIYTEYNIGHYARSFVMSDTVDRERIAAKLEDGVLTLTLPKTASARARRIAVN